MNEVIANIASLKHGVPSVCERALRQMMQDKSAVLEAIEFHKKNKATHGQSGATWRIHPEKDTISSDQLCKQYIHMTVVRKKQHASWQGMLRHHRVPCQAHRPHAIPSPLLLVPPCLALNCVRLAWRQQEWQRRSLRMRQLHWR